MRTSLIAGIWAGIAVGFFSFPLTKNVKRSCDIAVGSWGLAYVATFSYGAYQHNQLQHKLNAASSLPHWTVIACLLVFCRVLVNKKLLTTW